MRLVHLLGAVGLVLAAAWAAAAVEVGPGVDWCAAVNALEPGEELVLQSGEYRGPCTIRRGGTSQAPVVIRAGDPVDPPRIVYHGRDSNVLNILAHHVTIRGLRFGPTLPDVDGVRVYHGDGVVIEDCRFFKLGGIAIVANHSSVHRLTARRNEILQSNATALYFGCHDGVGCVATDLVIERNYIQGVDAGAGEIGYGVQIKLNSTATIRDNVIVDTKGPGIMVYGTVASEGMSVIERNLVSGSRTSSAIVVGGGPAIVRNNVVIRSAEAGIGLEDYGRRGLLRGVVIVHNTVYGNARGGISVPREGRPEAKLVNNAVHAPPGVPALPEGRTGVLALGNVDCRFVPCFRNPADWDFSPLALRPGLLLGEAWMPTDDYFGRSRGRPPTGGAIDKPAGRIPLGMKTRSP